MGEVRLVVGVGVGRILVVVLSEVAEKGSVKDCRGLVVGTLGS